MTSDDDEGLNYATTLDADFGSFTQTAARLRAERQAAMTPKQRERKRQRKRVRTEQINFRARPELKRLLDTGAAALGISAADLLEDAITEYCQKRKVGATS